MGMACWTGARIATGGDSVRASACALRAGGWVGQVVEICGDGRVNPLVTSEDFSEKEAAQNWAVALIAQIRGNDPQTPDFEGCAVLRTEGWRIVNQEPFLVKRELRLDAISIERTTVRASVRTEDGHSFTVWRVKEKYEDGGEEFLYINL